MPELPLYEGLRPDQITVVRTVAEAVDGAQHLRESVVIGFDTESKPTFNAGEQSHGPHVIQLATLDRAFIFQPQVHAGTLDPIVPILESASVWKVGFDLKGDRKGLYDRYWVSVFGSADLYTRLPRKENNDQHGIKSAFETFVGQQFVKSRSVSKSNWGRKVLTQKQVAYAAADAHGALVVCLKAIELGVLRFG
jgi:ribonuclease D